MHVADHPGDPAADRSEVIVAVDIGHSQVSPGATSARGKPEFEFNQAAGTMLVEELRRRGYSGAFLMDRGPTSNSGKEL